MKILIIRYGTIGDIIFTSPFLKNLREAYPQAQIDFLGDDFAQQLLKCCPYIDKIYKKKSMVKMLLEYYFIMRRYDKVYLLKNSSYMSKFFALCGIKDRIGFDIKKMKFLTAKIPYIEDRLEIECYLDMLRAENIQINTTQPEIWLDNDEETKIKEYLEKIETPKVVLHLYSRTASKDWCDEYWIKVIKYLSNKIDTQVFFTGAMKDREQYDNLIKDLGTNIKIPPINLAGKINLQELSALIKYSDAVISVDTGTIHIAAAYKKQSILIHNTTSLKRWKPQNENCKIVSKYCECSPCTFQTGITPMYQCKGIAPKCIMELTPDIVIEEINNILKV